MKGKGIKINFNRSGYLCTGNCNMNKLDIWNECIKNFHNFKHLGYLRVLTGC